MVCELYLNKSVNEKVLGYNSYLKYTLLYINIIKMENMILTLDGRQSQEMEASFCSCWLLNIDANTIYVTKFLLIFWL